MPERRQIASRRLRAAFGRTAAFATIPLLAGASLALAACSTAETFDRKINDLVDRRSRTLDGGAASPSRVYPEVDSLETSDQAEKTPETTNPAASQLDYEVAGADRDVAARLDEYARDPEEALRLDLTTTFRLAQESAREYLSAEEDYILAAIRLLIERHRWGPRFFNDTTLSADGPLTGDADTAVRVVNELRATQRLPYGGEVEARLVYQATELLRDAVANESTQSSSFILSGNIPLLRDAGLIAREELIQRERDLVYAARDFERFRRQFLVDIANQFFQLVAQRAALANQESSLESRLQSQERAEEFVEAGRSAAFEARTFQASSVQTRQQLIGLRENYLLALDRFKIRLGIPVETTIEIVPSTIDLPEPAAAPGEAAMKALAYRLDLQNRRDFINDNRRDVSNARNQLLPDLDLAGGLTLNTDPNDDSGGFGFRGDDSTYNASITFGLPLDREIERLNLRSAIINLQREIRGYGQFRDNVILDARAARRQIDQQRFTLRLAEDQVEINELRVEELKLKDGDPLDLNDAEDSLLRARNDVDNALRDLRNAVLDYLLATGQMRVRKDGQFQPLPGMVAAGSGADAGPTDGAPADAEAERPATSIPEVDPAPLDAQPSPEGEGDADGEGENDADEAAEAPTRGRK